MRDLVRRALGTADALAAAVTGKENIVARLRNQGDLSLAASSPAQVFSSFMTAVEISNELAETDKQALRVARLDEQAIVIEHDVLEQTLTTITDPNSGEQLPA